LVATTDAFHADRAHFVRNPPVGARAIAPAQREDERPSKAMPRKSKAKGGDDDSWSVCLSPAGNGG
jgi:hypothetical protein